MNTTTEPTRELIPLKLIEPWARNPRGGELREMESFTEQLRMEGIREDVHVFRDAQGVLRLMQGHRRREAAQRLGLEALWAKVWAFDENEAFLHLITMQNGADPFDARELALACRTAMGMGIEKERLIGVMHRGAETVQLYLDLGTLPHRVQEAVYRGKLALGTAGLLRGLSKEQLELAMDGVLNNPITQEPMTEGQARVFIENQFLKPERWRKKWAVESIKLKRKLVAGGMDAGLVDVVEWEDREQFVMSEAMPQSAYALCEEHIEDSLLVNPGEPMTWGELARSLGVPWHLCPAMARKEEHVLLVKMSAVKDADSTSAERVLRARGEKGKVALRNEEGGMANQEGEPSGERRAEGGESEQSGGRKAEGGESEDLDAEALASGFDEDRFRAVLGKLMERREAVMQDALWKPLMPLARACAVRVLPMEVVQRIDALLGQDEAASRQGMRHVLCWKWALASHASQERVMGEVEEVLALRAK